MAATSIHATLTRHFLRRFLENDLISPDADRSQTLAVVGAMLFSMTLLVALFMSFVYVGVAMTPSQLALRSLNDRFFYIAVSMVVTALLAVTQWDSLVVDVRDAAILEPLPVRPSVIRRAKLAAVALVGAGAALLVNLMPALIFPWLLVYHTRLAVAEMFALMIAHAIVTAAAAAFAYAAVIALREMLTAVFTPRWLTVVSPAVQGALIVILGSALLLIPPASERVERRGFSGWQAVSPPIWFLGVHEAMAGNIIRHAPAPSRLRPRAVRAEAIAAAAYDRHRPRFAVLARRAAAASGVVLLVAAAAYAWNARRFPSAAPLGSRRRWTWRVPGRVARLLVVRNQTSRAGFFFTLAAVWRSGVHRLTLACAAAIGVAAAVVTLSGTSLQNMAQAGNVPTGVFMIQPMFVGALLVAFRHGIRVPAELRANWALQLSWRNREREFLAGVRRGALLGIILPALLVLLLPLYWFLLGLPLAVAHAVLGFAAASVVLDALLFTYQKVPFTCTYLPSENLKALAIPYLVLFFGSASILAGMTQAALEDPSDALRLLVFLTAIRIALRVATAHRTPSGPMDFNEAPVTTQRLGLHT